MAVRRIIYSLALMMSFVIWLWDGTVFSFHWLLTLAVFPWLSLALSLPSMVTFQVRPGGEEQYRMGQSGCLLLQGTTRFPMPPFRGRLRLYPGVGGKRFWYDPVIGIPTDHCGGYRVRVERGWVYDYLGVFALPILHRAEISFSVLPQPKPAQMPNLENPPVRFWRSNPAVPPGEQYELRQFHWGDELKSLHWKLSLKTGKALVRSSQEPVTEILTLDVLSRGSREALDEKYGNLLWLGEKLLQADVAFQIRALTAAGISVAPIGNRHDLETEIARLLQLPQAPEEETMAETAGMWLWRVEEGMA